MQLHECLHVGSVANPIAIVLEKDISSNSIKLANEVLGVSSLSSPVDCVDTVYTVCYMLCGTYSRGSVSSSEM